MNSIYLLSLNSDQRFKITDISFSARASFSINGHRLHYIIIGVYHMPPGKRLGQSGMLSGYFDSITKRLRHGN